MKRSLPYRPRATSYASRGLYIQPLCMCNVTYLYICMCTYTVYVSVHVFPYKTQSLHMHICVFIQRYTHVYRFVSMHIQQVHITLHCTYLHVGTYKNGVFTHTSACLSTLIPMCVWRASKSLGIPQASPACPGDMCARIKGTQKPCVNTCIHTYMYYTEP